MTLALKQIISSVQDNFYYALFLAFLAILSIFLLGYEFIPDANQGLIVQFQRVDLVIATIFLLDFFLGLFFNNNRDIKAFFSKNWLNLISSIPITSDMTRALRILRIVRTIRIIRFGVNVWLVKKNLTDRRLFK